MVVHGRPGRFRTAGLYRFKLLKTLRKLFRVFLFSAPGYVYEFAPDGQITVLCDFFRALLHTHYTVQHAASLKHERHIL